MLEKFHIGAIVVAAIVSFFAGAAWYMTLGNIWKRALGWSDCADTPKSPPLAPFITLIVSELLMGAFFAGALYHTIGFSLENGLKLALIVWGFLIMPAMLSNNMFQHKKLMVSVIDGGHWLLVLLIIGLIVGGWV